MDDEAKSTKPRPFIFVLMPFDPSFDDIYKFGIKGAAEDVGAYAERIDEQIFNEGILDRVFNQINKADVVVADMTGRNANVFYEVGYAHALGKIVLLLTRDASDIPFDLQQQPHTVYEGKIELLRSELAKRIRWAVNEAKNKQTAGVEEPFELTLNDVLLPSGFSSKAPPLVMRVSSGGVPDQISIIVRNVSFEESETVSHIYLFTSENSVFVFYQGSSSSWWSPEIVKPFPADVAQGLGRQYWFSFGVRRLPPGTFEMLTIMVSANPGELNEGEEDIELRFHTSQRSHRYSFKLAFEKTPSP